MYCYVLCSYDVAVELCSVTGMTLNECYAMVSRAGPQSEEWSDQQITLNPTGSTHKNQGKMFDPKTKLILMSGLSFENLKNHYIRVQKSKLS